MEFLKELLILILDPEHTTKLTVALLGWFGSAASGTVVAVRKGANTLLWAVYAIFLGPVALIHAILKRRTPDGFESGKVTNVSVIPCPRCDESISSQAVVCPLCNRDIERPPAEGAAEPRVYPAEQ